MGWRLNLCGEMVAVTGGNNLESRRSILIYAK
jgi:hypothetical protein